MRRTHRWALAGTALAFAASPTAVAVAQDPGQPGAGPAPQDVEFVARASAGNAFEVRSSRLAGRRTQSPAVRAMAGDLINDHTRLQRELAGLAGQLGIPVGEQLTEQQTRNLRRLREARGRRFDQLFIRIQLVAHREAADLHVRAASDGGDPQLALAAIRALPIIGSHIGMAETIRDFVPAEANDGGGGEG